MFIGIGRFWHGIVAGKVSQACRFLVMEGAVEKESAAAHLPSLPGSATGAGTPSLPSRETAAAPALDTAIHGGAIKWDDDYLAPVGVVALLMLFGNVSSTAKVTAVTWPFSMSTPGRSSLCQWLTVPSV